MISLLTESRAMSLTAQQSRVLTLIAGWLRHQGYPPTVRELAQHLGVAIGTVQAHLRALERKGALTRRPFQARGLGLTAHVERAASDAVREVPIVGRVAAGTPVLAVENIEGVIPVSAMWAKGEELFCVRVRGQSMLPTLCEGDYLLVRRQAVVDNGAIAVVLMEGEVVVKRVVHTGHRLTLQSDNDAFPPLTVHLRQRPVQILGKAIGVYRQL
jgi:repressor LexA